MRHCIQLIACFFALESSVSTTVPKESFVQAILHFLPNSTFKCPEDLTSDPFRMWTRMRPCTVSCGAGFEVTERVKKVEHVLDGDQRNLCAWTQQVKPCNVEECSRKTRFSLSSLADWIRPRVKRQGTAANAGPPNSKKTNPDDEETETEPPEPMQKAFILYIIVACLIGVIILIGISVGLVLLRRRQTRRFSESSMMSQSGMQSQTAGRDPGGKKVTFLPPSKTTTDTSKTTVDLSKQGPSSAVEAGAVTVVGGKKGYIS